MKIAVNADALHLSVLSFDSERGNLNINEAMDAFMNEEFR